MILFNQNLHISKMQLLIFMLLLLIVNGSEEKMLMIPINKENDNNAKNKNTAIIDTIVAIGLTKTERITLNKVSDYVLKKLFRIIFLWQMLLLFMFQIIQLSLLLGFNALQYTNQESASVYITTPMRNFAVYFGIIIGYFLWNKNMKTIRGLPYHVRKGKALLFIEIYQFLYQVYLIFGSFMVQMNENITILFSILGLLAMASILVHHGIEMKGIKAPDESDIQMTAMLTENKSDMPSLKLAIKYLNIKNYEELNTSVKNFMKQLETGIDFWMMIMIFMGQKLQFMLLIMFRTLEYTSSGWVVAGPMKLMATLYAIILSYCLINILFNLRNGQWWYMAVVGLYQFLYQVLIVSVPSLPKTLVVIGSIVGLFAMFHKLTWMYLELCMTQPARQAFHLHKDVAQLFMLLGALVWRYVTWDEMIMREGEDNSQVSVLITDSTFGGIMVHLGTILIYLFYEAFHYKELKLKLVPMRSLKYFIHSFNCFTVDDDNNNKNKITTTRITIFFKFIYVVLLILSLISVKTITLWVAYALIVYLVIPFILSCMPTKTF